MIQRFIKYVKILEIIFFIVILIWLFSFLRFSIYDKVIIVSFI